MTPEQSVLRAERVAIKYDSGISESDAQDQCNEQPELYGIIGAEGKQLDMF